MKSYRNSLPNFAKPLVKLALILALLLVLPVAQVLAADITVDATCTLEQAIGNANSDSQGNTGCAEGQGTDTIILTGDVTLPRTTSAITSTIIIEGRGFTIDGGGNQVLSVNSGANLTINNVTIARGSARNGGGIYNAGTLTINNSTIRNNTASGGGGGIYHNNGSGEITLTIKNSTISNNTASSNSDGGGIYINTGTGEISNSTIIGNKAMGDNNGGGGIFVDGNLTLTHVTLVGNSASNAGGIYITGTSSNKSIYNSILANNSNDDCRLASDRVPKPENVGNLIGNPGDCGAGAVSADPMLGRLTGRPPYYPLLEGSPAIDAASSAHCTRKDQRGQARRITDCDIGAYEWHSGLVYMPKPPVRTTIALLPEIEVSDLTGSTEAQRIDAGGVGIQSVIDRGIVDAVDVWGFMGAGTQVCFLASGGSFSFLNAANSPRTVSSLPLYVIEGKTCTFIDGPGSIVLHPGAAPAGAATSNGPAWGLSNCMVTTTDVLNFRAGPGGEVIGGVPYNATLTALSRTAGWFEVDYHGTTGWISAQFVTPNGDCG